MVDILDRKGDFERTFTAYMLAPSMFYVHPERGLFAVLTLTPNANKDLGNSIDHCEWLGGRLYEPHFTTAFPAMRTMLAWEEIIKLALPVFKEWNDVKFVESKRQANWLKNPPDFAIADVPRVHSTR